MLSVSDQPMRLWMPTTLPSRSNSGPPESPPTMVQSVRTSSRRRFEDAAQPDDGAAGGGSRRGGRSVTTHWPSFEVGRLAHLGERPLPVVRPLALDLDHAAVEELVAAQRDAVGAGAVGEADLALGARLAGHVAGRQDEAVGADDHAAAGGLLLALDHHEADGLGRGLRHHFLDLRLEGLQFVQGGRDGRPHGGPADLRRGGQGEGAGEKAEGQDERAAGLSCGSLRDRR